jgi:MerR family transcriptional regulator, light-induced transcriptional regulator
MEARSMIEQINRLLALPDMPRYNIKAVVQQTQVNVSTLRAWEQRYGVPRPTRSDHGHRLYSQRDVEIIKWLKQCTEEGLAISQAVAMLRDINELGESASIKGASRTHAAQPLPQQMPAAEIGWPDLRARLSAALLDLNLRQAHLLVNTAVSLFPIETIVLDLFQPILVEIGVRWSHGDICVAQEHVVTNFVRQRLLSLTQLHAPFSHGPRLICACAPGEMHEIGLLMFALLMEQRGWELVYVGQSLEPTGLAEFLAPLAPAVVAMSASMVEHTTGLLEAAKVVASLKSRRLLLAFGGRAFERHPELRQRIPGTFLGNDLREAVIRADELGDALDPERRYVASGSFLRSLDSNSLQFGR